MTRLSMTYPALAVTLTLAAPANAYGVEPVAADVHSVAMSMPTTVQTAQAGDVCEPALTPSVLAILGLTDGFPTASTATASIALACDTQ